MPRKTSPRGRLAVAMSGGVDSSLAAALLVESGHNVIGVTMDLGLAGIAGCEPSGEDEIALAQRACDRLGIEHIVINCASEFKAAVIMPFCDAYASGLTPNPCVWCNEHIKLGLFATRVRHLGVQALASGHYARIVHDKTTWLERGVDPVKDQSYFLYRVPPRVLDFLEFPLGGFTKAEVRKMATERKLPSAERPESQEVCFTHDHVELVSLYHPEALTPGPIMNEKGTLLGMHRGIARYTVGQRKGLGIKAHGGPYRVVTIDPGHNTLIVAGADELYSCTCVTLNDPIWRLQGSASVLAQVRYRGALQAARAHLSNRGLEVAFETPVPPLAPGQSLVLYQGQRVVGGGFVPSVGD